MLYLCSRICPKIKMVRIGTKKRRVSPVVKWPGGKRRLLPDIINLLPENYGDYFEPFLGGGALFFALLPQKAVLGDVNEELIYFYKNLIDNPNKIIKRLQSMKNCSDRYYRIRSLHVKNGLEAAVRFLYLRRTCFNGLYRTNRNGDFNVPFGNNGRNIADDSENIIAAVEALKNAEIYCQDFEETCQMAGKGDLVFMDPPYTVTHENNNFIAYNAKIFTWEDQIRLRDLVRQLTDKKVKVIVTNAANYTIKELYSGLKIYTASRVSVLAAKKSARRLVNEFIITNF